MGLCGVVSDLGYASGCVRLLFVARRAALFAGAYHGVNNRLQHGSLAAYGAARRCDDCTSWSSDTARCFSPACVRRRVHFYSDATAPHEVVSVRCRRRSFTTHVGVRARAPACLDGAAGEIPKIRAQDSFANVRVANVVDACVTGAVDRRPRRRRERPRFRLAPWATRLGPRSRPRAAFAWRDSIPRVDMSEAALTRHNQWTRANWRDMIRTCDGPPLCGQRPGTSAIESTRQSENQAPIPAMIRVQQVLSYETAV